jgi:hypothetical protein
MIEKISKICWNDHKWSKPSGTNGKSPSTDSYENIVGYGHEEWLLDKSKIIDGYHYGFLQPLNLKTDRHVGNTYKIWLYSITSRQKFLVGYINDAICISKDESIEIFKTYKRNGWIKEMIKDLENAGINPSNFKKTPEVMFFNVKFKIKDIKLNDEYIKISIKDKNLTTTRYKLLDKVAEFKFEEAKQKGTDGYSRKFVNETFIDPYHNKIQNTLTKILRANKQFRNIQVEKNNIDVQATTNSNELNYFEIKTETPKNNIRQAIGQLFEYSFYPTSIKATKLIIIGDEEPSKEVRNYIKHLRVQTGLKLFYRWIDMDKQMLSPEL